MLIGFASLTLMQHPVATQRPVPFNIGDLVALISGIAWGAGTVLIRRTPHIEPMSILPGQYFCAAYRAVFINCLQIVHYPTRHHGSRQCLI